MIPQDIHVYKYMEYMGWGIAGKKCTYANIYGDSAEKFLV